MSQKTTNKFTTCRSVLLTSEVQVEEQKSCYKLVEHLPFTPGEEKQRRSKEVSAAKGVRSR